MTKVIVSIILSFLAFKALSQVPREESIKASETIGSWLIKSTGHYDFQSATSVNPKRAGTKFFGIPGMQTASDYGFSYMSSPLDAEVTKAYETIGADTSQMETSLKLPRLHLNFGFANKHDLTFSYLLPERDSIRGWGVGYKRVIGQEGYAFMTYRLNYSRARREDYFESTSFMNDLSVSLYMRLIDLYVGVRHWTGTVDFDSNVDVLKLPRVHYFAPLDEIEHYIGVMLASSLHSRLTLEVNSIGSRYALASKFSFHFDSLLPSTDNWFRDPRYIKQ